MYKVSLVLSEHQESDGPENYTDKTCSFDFVSKDEAVSFITDLEGKAELLEKGYRKWRDGEPISAHL